MTSPPSSARRSRPWASTPSAAGSSRTPGGSAWRASSRSRPWARRCTPPTTRVFAAATDAEGLAELRRHGLEILEDGQIGGLNGVLLGAAAEAGLSGACLLGEMPHPFAQLPFPKASQAVLEAFARLTGIVVDLAELSEQAREMEQRFGELLAQMGQALGPRAATAEEEAVGPEPATAERLGPADERHLEELFTRAAGDRSAAYELKRELDRLGVYPEYEDRFLDLFKRSE